MYLYFECRSSMDERHAASVSPRSQGRIIVV
jgi:hypothetical protein